MNKLQRLIQRLRAKGIDDKGIKTVVNAYWTGHSANRRWNQPQ